MGGHGEGWHIQDDKHDEDGPFTFITIPSFPRTFSFYKVGLGYALLMIPIRYKLTIAALFKIMTLQAWRGLRRQRQAKPNDKSEKVADQKRPQATCQEFVISSRIFALTSNCTSGDI